MKSSGSGEPTDSLLDDVIERLRVETVASTRAILAIQTLIARANVTKRPGGLRIYGVGGTGKSFIFEKIMKMYPRIDGGFRIQCPVVCISIPRRPTPTSVADAILKALGNSMPGARDADEKLEKDVIRSLDACQTTTMLFDEAHRILPASRMRGNKDMLAGDVGEYMKRLSDLSGRGMAWAGLHSFNELCEHDDQLGSRWPGSIELPQYKYTGEWRSLLVGLGNALAGGTGYKFDFDVTAEDVSRRMHAVTHGNFRRLKHLVSEMVRIASEERMLKLREEYLELAIDRLAMRAVEIDLSQESESDSSRTSSKPVRGKTSVLSRRR
ncbi:TniB family NTP-binding protein [Cupriavidus sp. TMH.W2]|uniref:TniB family NTP-binding protein n=1 Tax=Cupriavidus sp. TMH.W2 TaxID=3434465 RepID=UPI003D778A5B